MNCATNNYNLNIIGFLLKPPYRRQTRPRLCEKHTSADACVLCTFSRSGCKLFKTHWFCSRFLPPTNTPYRQVPSNIVKSCPSQRWILMGNSMLFQHFCDLHNTKHINDLLNNKGDHRVFCKLTNSK